jgi:hypothetical protein
MNKWKRWTMLSVLFLLFAQCNKCKEVVDPPEPEQETKYVFNWNVVFGNNDLIQGQTYNHIDGYRLLLEDFRGYVSNITLYDENDSAFVIQEIALLNWFNDPQLTITSAPRTIKRISFSLGIPASINTNTDPTTYPNSSPLSVGGAAGMFWTWNSGYIMAKLEGSSNQSGASTKTILYHVGGFKGINSVLKTISPSFNGATANVSSTVSPEVHIKCDVMEWFKNPNTINLATLHTIHMPGANAKLIADNYTDMFSVEHIHN